MKNYPRVLIVNLQSMDRKNATGITLSSLWRDWPNDKLQEVSFEMISSNRGIEKVVARRGTLAKLMKSNIGNSLNGKVKNTTVNNSFKGSSWKSNLRQVGAAIYDCIPGKLKSLEWKQIRDFKPDIIYTLGGSVTALRLANQISKRINVPLVIHFMDNWPESIQWDANPYLGFYKSLLSKHLENAVNLSEGIITISPSMDMAYKKRFNKNSCILMNCVETDALHCEPKNNNLTKKFVYTGGLHLDRWKALKDIACVLKKQCSGAFLEIYTNNNIESLKNEFNGLPVKFCKAIPHERIKEVLNEADVLVHAESNAPELMGFFRYSISTKIPEYLSSGRPIILYEPAELGLYKYIEDNNVGYVASNVEELKCVINKVQVEDNVAMIDRALKLAQQNHSLENNNEKLRAFLTACIVDKS